MTLRRFLFLIFACLACGPPAMAQSVVTGTITASQCVPIDVSAAGVVGISVTGGSWSGTIQPQVALGGDPAVNTKVTPYGSTTAQSTITANGAFQSLSVAGGSLFQLCGNTVTGTATVKLKVAPQSASSGGGGTGGTVTSVSGTANQIDVATQTTTPVVSLDAAITLPGNLTAPTGSTISATGSGVINATQLGGATFAAPGPIGSGTAGTGAFSTLSATGAVSGAGFNPFVKTGQTNVYGAFLQDFTASTMEVPEAAGFTTNVDSTIGLDTTANIFHFWTNGADSLNAATTATSTTTTQPLFATAVAGIYNPRAIAAADLPSTLTSGTAITNAALTTPTLGTPASGTLTNATGLPLNGVISPASAPATFADGNFPLIFNCALTSGTTCLTTGETTAASTAGAVEDQITTLTTSTAIPLQITMGANGPASANAPAVLNVSAAAAGGLATASQAGFVGAPITLLTGAGSAGGATTGNGGAGGGLTVTLGGGGAHGGASGNTGGAGGAYSFTPGAGVIGGGTGPGGAAGSTTFASAAGGSGGITSGTGGVGSDFLVNTGAGGGATAGSTTGRGGNAVFTLGSAGGGGTAGAPGNFQIAAGTVAGANTTSFLNLTGTWNTTGIDAGAVFANITCTAAAALSKEFDFQIGGASQLNLSFAGANCATPLLTSAGNIVSGVAAGAPNVDKTIGFLTSAMGQQTTATCTNVTSMTWNLAASKNYALHCQIPITFAASATIAFCLGGPGTPTSYNINAVGSIGAAGVYDDINLIGATVYSGSNKTTASGAVGASTQLVLLDAAIQNGATASGTALTLQTAANGTNGFTILADAACELKGVN